MRLKNTKMKPCVSLQDSPQFNQNDHLKVRKITT